MKKISFKSQAFPPTFIPPKLFLQSSCKIFMYVALPTMFFPSIFLYLQQSHSKINEDGVRDKWATLEGKKADELLFN